MMQKIDMLNTKKMKRIFLFGLLALLVVSCSSNSDEQEPTSDDEVTITYPKDTSEHELTDFRCQLVSDENGNHWEIKFDREQVNPFMGGGDEEGAIVTVTNMKDEWKALKDETVVVSGKYRALHTKYFHRNQATITYYSFEITQVRKYEPKPTEPKYQVAKITIDVDNNMAVTSKEDYRGCNIKIESDNDEWDYEGRGRIRGRGNSTWEWYPKKPYRLKLDEKASILGLAEEKDWVMLANYRDPTHLMNTFVFEMGSGLGIPYTNHTRFVELTLNGDYKGLYMLTEQVEQSKSRVNISSKKGWLLSLDVDDGPEEAPGEGDNFWSQVYRMPVCVKSPEAEDYATPETLISDARTALSQIENLILAHDYDALAKVMDIGVMIDYLLIQELVYNVEVAAPRSIYLYKDDGAGSLWTFGPLWDFDAGYDFDWGQMRTGHTFFTDYRETVLGTDPARHISNYTYVPSFFTDMWKSRQFVSQVKARWKEISPRIMSEFWPEARRYAICAAEAMGRNAERWPIDKDYQTEIDRMEKWLQLRTAFMDQLVANYPAGN